LYCCAFVNESEIATKVSTLTEHRTACIAVHCTLKKKETIFLVYKEIQMGAVAKSFMRQGFLIYSMRKCANI
jgi:hypothetical protein